MPNINIRAEVLAITKSLLPNGWGHRDMAVEADQHFVPIRSLPESLERGYGQFTRNGPSSQRLGERKRLIEFIFCQGGEPVKLHDSDGHASLFVFFTKIFGLAHRERQAPLAQLISRRFVGGQLLGRLRRATLGGAA